jgi:hypothetical protein
MSAEFDKCVKNGGKVRTISGPDKQFGVKEGQYLHVCFLNGEMYRGEVKQKQDFGQK